MIFLMQLPQYNQMLERFRTGVTSENALSIPDHQLCQKKSESFPVFGPAANLHPPEQSLLVQLRPDHM